MAAPPWASTPPPATRDAPRTSNTASAQAGAGSYHHRAAGPVCPVAAMAAYEIVVPERLCVLPRVRQKTPASILQAVIPPAIVANSRSRNHKVVVKEIHRVSTKPEWRDVPHQAVTLCIFAEDLHLPRFRNNKSNGLLAEELVWSMWYRA